MKNGKTEEGGGGAVDLLLIPKRVKTREEKEERDELRVSVSTVSILNLYKKKTECL